MERQPESIDEKPPEPESVTAVRQALRNIEKLLDAGGVQSISVYVEGTDGCYRNFQTETCGRHEDAGRLLELAMYRLGFRLPAD